MHVPRQNADTTMKEISESASRSGENLQEKVKKALRKKMDETGGHGHPVIPKGIEEYVRLLMLNSKNQTEAPPISTEGGEADSLEKESVVRRGGEQVKKHVAVKESTPVLNETAEVSDKENADERAKPPLLLPGERSGGGMLTHAPRATAPEESHRPPMRQGAEQLQQAPLETRARSDDTRINYVFRQGDGQHSVQVQLSGSGAQSNISLTPSDPFVGQRLQNALSQEAPASHVVLSNHNTDSDGRQAQQETLQEEDDE